MSSSEQKRREEWWGGLKDPSISMSLWVCGGRKKREDEVLNKYKKRGADRTPKTGTETGAGRSMGSLWKGCDLALGPNKESSLGSRIGLN